MKFFQKKFVWAIAYGIVLFGFTLFVVLDSFVIERTYVVVGGSSSSKSAVTSGSVNANGEITDASGGTENADGTDSADGSGEAAEAGGTEQTASDGSAAAAAGSSASTAKGTSGAISSARSSSASGSTSAAQQTVISTDTLYSDGNITIQLQTYRENNTNIYVADVTLSSAEYLQTFFAKNAYGKNVTQTTSAIASNAGSLLAINGDYYGARNSGYVIRNGVLYRSTSAGSDQEDLVIYQNGSFDIITEGSVSAQTLLANGAQQVFSFGPGLIENGSIAVSTNTEVDKSMTSNPRTALGMISDLHYVFVVSDGRTSASTGLSLYQLAEFMQGLGVQTAYNFDGGGSSTMYFNGSVINQPTTNGKTITERAVSDIVSIGY